MTDKGRSVYSYRSFFLCIVSITAIMVCCCGTSAAAGQTRLQVTPALNLATVTTTPTAPPMSQTVSCSAPCECLFRSDAVAKWGETGISQCAELPCAYEHTATGAIAEKYCFRQKAVTNPPVVANIPPVTTTATYAQLVTVPQPTTTYPAVNKDLMTTDTDKDGRADFVDNCPGIPNPGQEDYDKDGVGDECDTCVHTANPGQEDTDGDKIGDACDLCPKDKDPSTAGNLDDREAPGYADADNDGIGDRCDPCPNSPDTDKNGDGCGPCDFGTFKITNVIPIQVMDDNGIPLVEGKGTVFKVTVQSTYPCARDVKFKLTLPDDQWGTTGWKTGIFPRQPFPSFEGPVVIPANAKDFVVILPYIPAGKTNETANPAKNDNIGKIVRQPISAGPGPGLSGTAKYIRPDFRVMPTPIKTAQGKAEFWVEIDPTHEVPGYHAPSYTYHGWENVVTTRPWKFLFINEKFENVASRPEKTDPGEKASIERILATFPIADDAISGTVMPSIGMTPCENGVSDHQCSDDIDQLPWCVNKNPCIGPNNQSCQYYCYCPLPDKDLSAQCPYSYDIDAGPYGAEQKSAARYKFLAETAKKWGYDIGIGVSIYGGQEDPGTQSMTINPYDRFWLFAHEFNHFAVPMGDVPNYMDNCTRSGNANGFWVNNYEWMKKVPYFMDGPSGYNWMIEPSTKALNSANAVCLNEINTVYGGDPRIGGMNSDGYLNLINNPRFKIKDPEGLLVSGTVFKNGTANLSSFSYLPATELDVQPGSRGDYTFVLLDGAGKVISSGGFSLTFKDLTPDNPGVQAQPQERDFAWFVRTIEWKAGTQRIELRDKNGRVLASRIVSPNSPSVKIISPNGGETWALGGPVTLRWQGTDPDGGNLMYDIGISGDGGRTWVPLANNLAGTSYTIRPGGLAGGDSYRVKVIVSDGVNTASAVSDANFRIDEKGWISIALPAGIIVLVIGAAAGAGWYLMRKKKA